MGTDARLKLLDRDGMTLAVEERGQGDPPLLFIHGWCCDRRYFQPQVEHFSARQRVIAVDLRGHGASDAPADGYTIEGFANDVAWVCDAAGILDVVAIGHSMGGQIAFELANQRPELVRGLVLIETPLIISGRMAENMTGFIDALRGPEHASAARDFVSSSLFLPESDPNLRERVASEMSAAPQHVMAESWAALVRYGVADKPSCSVPTLFVDARYPTRIEPQLRAALPNLTIATTDGLGHFPQLEDPARVNGLIDAFVYAIH